MILELITRNPHTDAQASTLLNSKGISALLNPPCIIVVSKDVWAAMTESNQLISFIDPTSEATHTETGQAAAIFNTPVYTDTHVEAEQQLPPSTLLIVKTDSTLSYHVSLPAQSA